MTGELWALLYLAAGVLVLAIGWGAGGLEKHVQRSVGHPAFQDDSPVPIAVVLTLAFALIVLTWPVQAIGLAARLAKRTRTR